MLTNKNRRTTRLAVIFFLALGLAGLATGCKPVGVRALLSGKKLLEQRKFDAAVDKFKVATAAFPTNALAWNYLALAQHSAGHAVEAASAYQTALNLNPNLLEARYSYGCLLLEQNNPAAAKNEFTTYTLSRPKEADGWLKLGAAQWRSGDAAGAERSYAEALRLNQQSAEAWNIIGLAQLRRNRPADAAKYFDAALRCQPDYAPALLNFAIVQQQQLNNRPLALQKYREYAALKSAPNAEAVAAVIRALEAELNPPAVTSPPVAVVPVKPPPVTRPPTNPPVVAVVKPLPRPPVAVVSPKTNPAAVTPVAAISNAIPTGNPAINSGNTTSKIVVPPLTASPAPIARYAYHLPGKVRPGNRVAAETALAEGLLNQQRQQLPEALAAFELAVKADPTYFKAHYNLAWTAYALKDWPTALEAYESALTLDPDSASARYNFALTLKQAGYPLDAVNELSKLLAKKPDDAAAHLLTANLYAQQLGGPALARPHYLKVLELEPDHPQGTQVRYWLNENP